MAPPEGIKFDDINIAAGPANKRYGQSKLAMLLYAKSLDKRYGPGSEGGWNGEIWTAAVHPGLVAT